MCFLFTELELNRCYNIDDLGLGEVKKLTNLTRLDISYTQITTETLCVVLRDLTKLLHLSISGCRKLAMDELCIYLGRFCPDLISFRAWKTQHLTHRGLGRHLKTPEYSGPGHRLGPGPNHSSWRSPYKCL